jgi:hypothetical protein
VRSLAALIKSQELLLLDDRSVVGLLDSIDVGAVRRFEFRVRSFELLLLHRRVFRTFDAFDVDETFALVLIAFAGVGDPAHSPF